MTLCISLRHLLPLLLQLLPEIHITLTKWQTRIITSQRIGDNFDLFQLEDAAASMMPYRMALYFFRSLNRIKFVGVLKKKKNQGHRHANHSGKFPFSNLNSDDTQCFNLYNTTYYTWLWVEGFYCHRLLPHLHCGFRLLKIRSWCSELIYPGFSWLLWHLNNNDEQWQWLIGICMRWLRKLLLEGENRGIQRGKI